MNNLGATGEFPQGKLNKSDEGELRMAIYVENSKIVINFGKDLSWLGLDKDTALALAENLKQKANEI